MLKPFAKIASPLLTGLVLALLLPQLLPTRAEPLLSVTGGSATLRPGGETTLRLQLLNHTDQIVYEGVLSATLPPGLEYVTGSTTILGEGWPMDSSEPLTTGNTLTWGPYHLPAAGVTAHNPFGIHTMMDSCDGIPALHLEGAKTLAGSGGYVTQLFYPIDTGTTGPSQCAINFVNEAYARNLIPILRLQGHRVNGIWQAPDPGPAGDYAAIAQAFANYVAGLPRRDTNPLYIAVWNEPDLWIEWSGRPNATQYARFFVAVSNAIRRLGDARIRIVNGALTPGNPVFLEQMLRVPGFRDAFDVWASHCYPYNHPAWYNNHAGTATYGTYTIDCYREELPVIARFGRSNVKVILTETGYKLGDNLYNFEGFPTINDANRAGYIESAFRDYWQNWPEIVAVTPFELTDPAGFWHVFDWVRPTAPYTPYLQFTRVAALPKPAGELQPYGYQALFKIRAAPDALTGVYTLTLHGSERGGALVDGTVAVTVTNQSYPYRYYLPVILKSPGRDGPWYITAAKQPPDEGTLAPTRLITTPAALQSAGSATVERLPLSAEPVSLALDPSGALAAVLLQNGHLLVINLPTFSVLADVFVGDNPQQVVAADAGVAYVSLAGQVARVDLRSAQVTARFTGLGLPRGLAWDAAARRLLVADAARSQLLALSDDLSRQLAAQSLPHQPDRLQLPADRLLVTFPGAGQIAAYHPTDLRPLAVANIPGGPILDFTVDSAGQLAVLHALAPGHHTITLLDAATLAPIELLAADPRLPLSLVSAVATAPPNALVASTGAALWDINLPNFTARQVLAYNGITPPGGIAPARTGHIILLDAAAPALLKIERE
ncbi:MAG: hypothetical protein Kow0031_25340 [Anaerolineae bacterium]